MLNKIGPIVVTFLASVTLISSLAQGAISIAALTGTADDSASQEAEMVRQYGTLSQAKSHARNRSLFFLFSALATAASSAYVAKRGRSTKAKFLCCGYLLANGSAMVVGNIVANDGALAPAPLPLRIALPLFVGLPSLFTGLAGIALYTSTVLRSARGEH